MYACTGASPSAFAICGFPPERRTTRSRLPLLRWRTILSHGGLHERLERARVDRLPLVDVDRPPRVAFQARIEEARGIREAGAPGERELHHLLVCLPGAD